MAIVKANELKEYPNLQPRHVLTYPSVISGKIKSFYDRNSQKHYLLCTKSTKIAINSRLCTFLIAL